MNSMDETPIVARVVEDPVKRIQIPPNLRPGDSFIVTPDYGTPFTVIVPEGAIPGTYINVIVPAEAEVVGENTRNNNTLKIDKATAGAALVGGVVGAVCFGAIGGILLAGGVAYAATRKDSKIGEEVRKVGGVAYKSAAQAKNFVDQQIEKHTKK